VPANRKTPKSLSLISNLSIVFILTADGKMKLAINCSRVGRCWLARADRISAESRALERGTAPHEMGITPELHLDAVFEMGSC
jgi:hypothetical protein